MIIYTRTTSLLVDFHFVDVLIITNFAFCSWCVDVCFRVCCPFSPFIRDPKKLIHRKRILFRHVGKLVSFFFVLLLRRGVAAMMRCDCVELWSRIVCGSSALSGSVLLVLFLVYFTIHYRLILSCNINTSCCNNGVLSTGVSVIDRSFIVILFAELVFDRQSTELLFATLFCIISSLIIHNLLRFCFFLHKTQFRFLFLEGAAVVELNKQLTYTVHYIVSIHDLFPFSSTFAVWYNWLSILYLICVLF